MDGTVRLWSLESGAAQGMPLKAHVRGVVALAYDPLKHVLYSVGLDRHLHVWNPFLETPLCALKVAAYHPTLTLLTTLTTLTTLATLTILTTLTTLPVGAVPLRGTCSK